MEEEPKDIGNLKQKSTIPSVNGNWYYPSRNQFYRTTKLKGYSFSNEDLDIALQIHNAVNEETWKRIMKIEEKYFEICKDQKLIRFVGKPSKLSFKASVLHLLGYNKPFDRHDWYIDRCGKTIKYIIDYYDGKKNAGSSSPVSIYIDARPQFTYNNMVDKLKVLYLNFCKYMFY